MNDATKPPRTRNALTLEQFYRLCQWLNKWQPTFEAQETMEQLIASSVSELQFTVTTAHMERAISVTGIKPPFMTAADRAAAEAAKTARAEKAGPRLLAALKALAPDLHESELGRSEKYAANVHEAIKAMAEAEGE
jgi:lysophospholipase L1-like esterase